VNVVQYHNLFFEKYVRRWFKGFAVVVNIFEISTIRHYY